MLLDPETLDLAHGIEEVLATLPPSTDGPGQARAHAVRARDRDQALRGTSTRRGSELAELRQMMVERRRGAGDDGRRGRHPPVRAAGRSSRSSIAARYHELVEELGYIARRELIFGTHVHVAIEGADRAIYVADGIRRYLPLLLALSTNSPVLARPRHRDDVARGLPVFRGFPAGRHPAPLRDLGDLLAPRRDR